MKALQYLAILEHLGKLFPVGEGEFSHGFYMEHLKGSPVLIHAIDFKHPSGSYESEFREYSIEELQSRIDQDIQGVF